MDAVEERVVGTLAHRLSVSMERGLHGQKRGVEPVAFAVCAMTGSAVPGVVLRRTGRSRRVDDGMIQRRDVTGFAWCRIALQQEVRDEASGVFRQRRSRHDRVWSDGARVAEDVQDVAGLKPLAGKTKVWSDASACAVEAVAAEAGEFVAEQERGFVQREGASGLRMVFRLEDDRAALLREQERADGTGFLGVQPEVGHARAVARLMAERTERGGMSEETFQPRFLDAQPFVSERRRGVGAWRDGMMAMTCGTVQRAEQRFAVRHRDVGKLVAGGGEILFKHGSAGGVEREEVAGDALDFPGRSRRDFTEVTAVPCQLKELRGHRRGRNAEPRRRDEILTDPFAPETNAGIGEFDSTMATFAFVVVAGQADQPARELGMKLILRDGRGVARSVQADRQRRPVTIRLALAFEEDREGQRFLRGQREGGHSCITNVVTDAGWTLKKVEEPCRLVTKARAAEVWCEFPERTVLRQICVALRTADLRDKLSAVGDLVRLRRLRVHARHQQESDREQRDWQPTMAGRGHEPF